MVRIKLQSEKQLGAEIFRWEMATAILGYLLDINPFDQPDVESAKKRAREALEKGDERPSIGDASGWLDQIAPPQYLAIQAFVAPNDENRAALEAARVKLRDKYHVAVTARLRPPLPPLDRTAPQGRTADGFVPASHGRSLGRAGGSRHGLHVRAPHRRASRRRPDRTARRGPQRRARVARAPVDDGVGGTLDGRIGNVVFDAPAAGSLERYGKAAGSIAALYAELLGLPLQSRADFYRSLDYPADEGDEVDPLLRSPEPDGIGIAFEFQSEGYEPPRWPDPAYPQQIHVDIFVRDIDAAEELVVGLDAAKLQDHGRHRVYADPVGHPFCLYEEPTQMDGVSAPGRIGRIVFDCPDPRSLAAFYSELMGLPERVEDSAAFVVIARDDGKLPMLAFQQSDGAVPRWPDPIYPEQVHLDLGFDDNSEARRLAERLGATRLTPDHVFADPAGHPFCLGD